MAIEKITIGLDERAYDVVVGADIFTQTDFYQLEKVNKIAIITDEAVAKLYAQQLQEALQEKAQVIVIEVPAGEKSKSWHQLEKVCDRLIEAGFKRQDLIIALGGGIVCDLAGFVAAIYMRGLNHVMIPTTLLAQVDASVGGKTAINTSAGKNLIGSFHQPKTVIADVKTLASLPKRDFVAGLAECVKHSLLDEQLFEFTLSKQQAIVANDFASLELLAELVTENVKVKANVVAQDETENDIRAHLNLGHTFAHAFEAVDGYGDLLHGEAVAVGLVAACRLSNKLGLASEKLGEHIEQILTAFGLPTSIKNLDNEKVLTAMTVDKKNVADTIRFVVIEKPGTVMLSNQVGKDLVMEVLESVSST